MVLPMENTEKMIFPGVGKYGIPEIKPETDIRIDRLEWIPVNYAMTATDKKAKACTFTRTITSLNGSGTTRINISRFCNSSARYVRRIFLCTVICRLRCSFLCITKSTGLPHTGRRTAFTLSQRFAGAENKAMTGALTASPETPL